MTGLDLSDAANLSLIRSVFFGRFARRCIIAGLEPDDVFSAVCLSVIVRNNGEHPYDPERGTKLGWAYAVCAGATGHALERHRRRRLVELLGLSRDARLDQVHT